MMSPLGVLGGSHFTSAKYGLLTLKVVIDGGVPGTEEGYIQNNTNHKCVTIIMTLNHKCEVIILYTNHIFSDFPPCNTAGARVSYYVSV